MAAVDCKLIVGPEKLFSQSLQVGRKVEIGVNNIYAWGGREEREGVVKETQTRGVSVVVARRSEGVAWETQTRDQSVIVAQTRRNLTTRDAGETWVIS